MQARPTALNKRGNKVLLDGYKFDSQKEAYILYMFPKRQSALS